MSVIENKTFPEFFKFWLIYDQGRVSFQAGIVGILQGNIYPWTTALIMLKGLIQYPKKLTVRLHHVHHSNAAPVTMYICNSLSTHFVNDMKREKIIYKFLSLKGWVYRLAKSKEKTFSNLQKNLEI